MPDLARLECYWHEDIGDVLWWKFPVQEAPWVGTPNDDCWTDTYTHFTLLPEIPIPEDPWWKDAREDCLLGCRQSGFHFFADGPLSRRIAAYPGSTSEQHAREQFVRDNPEYYIPF